MGNFYRCVKFVDSPCKDCPDREVGCHGRCDKYQEYVKKKDELMAKYKKENYLQRELAEDKYNQMARMRKAKINWKEKGLVK